MDNNIELSGYIFPLGTPKSNRISYICIEFNWFIFQTILIYAYCVQFYGVKRDTYQKWKDS